MALKKNYKKETCKTKEIWLAKRGIGASDAAAIVGKSKWLTKYDIAKRLLTNEPIKERTNSRMVEGTLKEPLIRATFALDTNYEIINPPKKSYWLYRSKEEPLLTLTPDGFIVKDGKLFGLEIKDCELHRAEQIEMWESNVLPEQYYYQLLHYMIVLNDIDGVCLVAHLKYYAKDEETGKWNFSYAVDRQYWVYRQDVLDHIKYLKDKELDFVNQIKTSTLDNFKEEEMKEDVMFELDTISDVSHGILRVRDYEKSLAMVNDILNSYPVYKISTDAELKEAKATRALFNKTIKAIDRKRIDTIEEFVGEFKTQCNDIKALLDARATEFGNEIDEYIANRDVINQVKTYKAIITFEDKNMIEKINEFCKKNNLNLTIKE